MTPDGFGNGGGRADARGSGRARASAVLGVAAVLLLSSAPVAADGEGGSSAATPSESGAEAPGVALSGDAPSPMPGEEFLYRATVTNDGAERAEGALLAQHVPAPLEVVEVGQDGVLEEGVANWRIDLPAGEETVRTVRVRVSETAPADARAVSTACLLLDRDEEPTACASETLLIAEPTMLSRVGDVFDRDTMIRAMGAGALMLLAWLFWRQWGPAARRT